MKTISLRPVEPERDFGQLASLFTSEQDEPTSESGLMADYEQRKERIIRLMVAEDEEGEPLGFTWATRSRFDLNEVYFYVIVKPEQRGLGVGSVLYEDLEKVFKEEQVKKLQVSIRDTCPICRSFAEQHGFSLRKHSMAMALNLDSLDDRPYDDVIARLKNEGFQFTSMGALGNTEEAQRKLYAFNDMTDSETPGSEGEHAWLSFEDFQKSVCLSDWYKPDGQMVVIDSKTGIWVALSAITRFEGVDYAYNLHTGVDKRYRRRKIGQAVKIHALRYAREALKVKSVHTHHNTQNDPMIAIDRKFGYVQIPGIFLMEKVLEER